MNTDITRPLPDGQESELMLISACLGRSDTFLEVSGLLTASDFSRPELSTAWRWFHEMQADNRRIGLYSLKQFYGNDPQYQRIRDALTEVAGVIPIHAVEYAKTIIERNRLRAAVLSIAKLKESAERARSFEEIREEIESLFMDASQVSSSKGFRKADVIVADVEHRAANPVAVKKYRTGFRSLDDMLKGGFKDGQLVIVAGRTGGGKTVLAMNIAVQVALDAVPVAAFSLEMADMDLVTRCIFSESVFKRQEDAIKDIRNLPMWIDDTSGVTVKSIAARMKLMHLRHGIKLFVVDYLQLIGTEQGSRENRERLVAEMSRTLKITARALGVVVIALSQVNESGELRESRAIEQDADAVIYVLSDADDNWHLRLCKQRGGASHGPQAWTKSKDDPGIRIRFHKENFRFSE